MNRFNVKEEDFPHFKIFLKGKDPLSFNGAVTEQELTKFVRDSTGFWFGKLFFKQFLTQFLIFIYAHEPFHQSSNYVVNPFTHQSSCGVRVIK